MATRKTFAIVDRIERNGFGTLHEEGSAKPGFFSNTTVRSGSIDGVRPGSRVAISVDDNNDLMIVRGIAPA